MNPISPTPGPWTFEPGKVAPENLGGTIKGPTGEYIASVQWRGNGPLLAAASELLSVCEAIHNRYNHDDRLGGLGDWLADVIAKAEGRLTLADWQDYGDYLDWLNDHTDDADIEERIGARETYRRQEGMHE